MDIALVQDLSDLAPRLQDGHTNEAGLKEATDLLSKIDQRLKDQRESPHSFPVSGTRGFSSYDQANAKPSCPPGSARRHSRLFSRGCCVPARTRRKRTRARSMPSSR